MNLKKALIASMLASSFGAVASPAQAQVIIDIAPPALEYEVVPAPRAGYVWEQGYWRWNGRRHVWVAGHWEQRRPGYAYVAPRWMERDGRWYYYERRWDRDRDGDGVPNRRDSHPDNPYRS